MQFTIEATSKGYDVLDEHRSPIAYDLESVDDAVDLLRSQYGYGHEVEVVPLGWDVTERHET
jgi:hypothetical protein